MKLAIEWQRWSDKDTPAGLRVVLNPRCRMYVQLPETSGATIDDWTIRCGKPATVRASLWPYWSALWCEEHARIFSSRVKVSA